MVRKYIFGEPVETGAAVNDCMTACELPSYLKKSVTDEEIIITYQFEDDEAVYGLGEQVRGINKRGFSYISNATDDPVHTENKHSLYCAHNFIILAGKNTGLFVDYPGVVKFDAGETKSTQLVITAGKDCVIYLIEADSLKAVVKQFRELVGQSYIPPKWAFGYQQSRWSYENEDAVRNVIRRHHGNNIPLEAVYLDIDYMEGFKNFTVNTDSFPDLKDFTDELKKEGVHLVPIIDAGVKVEDGYETYEEGVAGNYFCKDEDGDDFVGAAWPGKVMFPDFLNADAREWFGGKYRWLINQGIDGFWNDMNEPAIFYSAKNLKNTFDKVSEMKDMNLDIGAFFYLRDTVNALSNNPDDYKSFYHTINGKRVRHDFVHNLYGYNMTRAASEAFDKIVPEQRILLFSRSSYIGMHRYGGIWTGDNNSWWSHLLLSIQQMPSLNMCGMLYSGSDIGGFGCDATEDLLMRWLEFGIFTPLMRNHAAIGTRQQEVYQFDRLDDFKNIIRTRYSLIPYIYSEFMKSVLDNEMYFRPLAFDYPDDKFAVRTEDQLMVGGSIMIAPVYTQNGAGRYVYLPEDMLMVHITSPCERKFTLMKKGHHYIEIALNELVIFIKKNHVLPMAVLDDDVKTTRDIEGAAYEWLGYVDDTAEYVLYDDDGISKEYTPKEQWRKYVFSGENFGDGYIYKEK